MTNKLVNEGLIEIVQVRDMQGNCAAFFEVGSSMFTYVLSKPAYT